MKLHVAKYIKDHNLKDCVATAFDTLEVNMYDDEVNWDRIVGIWNKGEYTEIKIKGINNIDFRQDVENAIKGYIKRNFKKI